MLKELIQQAAASDRAAIMQNMMSMGIGETMALAKSLRVTSSVDANMRATISYKLNYVYKFVELGVGRKQPWNIKGRRAKKIFFSPVIKNRWQDFDKQLVEKMANYLLMVSPEGSDGNAPEFDITNENANQWLT